MSDATDCIFCKIVQGAFGTEFIAESEHAVAFRDIHPAAPTHVLVVPKRHVTGLQELLPGDTGQAGELLALAAAVARSEGIADSGYRIVINDGADGGQSVFHLHLHVLGGRRLSAGMG